MSGPWEKYAAAPAPAGPWQKYAAAPAPQAAPDSDVAGAALEGFGQGASMGYLPQLQAAASKPMEKVLNALGVGDTSNDDLEAKGFKVSQPDQSYVQLRDENIARQQKLAKDNPKAYYGGMLAGGVATAPVAELGAAKIAPEAMMASKLGKAVATGATIGAAANPGDTAGEITPLQLGDRAKNAAIGATIGAVAHKVGDAIGAIPEALGASSEKLETMAEKNALRSAGAQKPQFKALNNAGVTKDAGRFIIDEGLVKPGDSAEDIFDRVQDVKKDAGKQISQVFDKLEASGKAGTFDRSSLAQSMRDSLQMDDSVGGSLDAKKVLAHLDEYVTNFENEDGPASAKQLLELKGKFDNRINYSKQAQDLPELQQGYRNLRSTINEAINDRAEKLSNEVRGDLGQQLKDANRRYSLASRVSDIAENKMNQEGNNFFSLTDKMAGGVGALAGMATGGVTSIPKAAAAMLASKALRTYGPAAGTALLDTASTTMGKLGNVAESVAPRIPAASQAIKNAAMNDAVQGGVQSTRPVLSPDMRRPTFNPIIDKKAVDNSSPTKGPDKWAQDGIKNLKIHTDNSAQIEKLKAQMLADPKGKQMLIAASDLKPGSKGMNNLMERIQAEYGNSSSKR